MKLITSLCIFLFCFATSASAATISVSVDFAQNSFRLADWDDPTFDFDLMDGESRTISSTTGLIRADGTQDVTYRDRATATADISVTLNGVTQTQTALPIRIEALSNLDKSLPGCPCFFGNVTGVRSRFRPLLTFDFVEGTFVMDSLTGSTGGLFTRRRTDQDPFQISASFTAATPVPLPAGAPMLLAGLGAFMVLRRRARHSA